MELQCIFGKGLPFVQRNVSDGYINGKSVLGLLKYMSSFSKNRDREASGSRRQALLSTCLDRQQWPYISSLGLQKDIYSGKSP